MLYIILKYVIWRIRIYSLLCEIFEYRENMSNNGFRKIQKALLKSQNLIISRNKLYISDLQITFFKMIHNMFIFYESDIFRTPENDLNFDNFPKIAHKIAKSKYFVDI